MTPTLSRRLTGWLASVVLVAAVTLLIKLVHPHGPSRGLAVIYILAVVWVAVRFGPSFAFVASMLSVAAFDYFSLNDESFAVVQLADAEAVAAFLATAVMASVLAGRLRSQVRQMARLAQEQAALRRIASLVAQGLAPFGVFAQIADELRSLVGAEIALLARTDADGVLTVVARRGGAGTDVTVGSRWSLTDPSSAEDAGIGSSLVGPVVIEGRTWGAIVVGTRDTPLPAGAAQHTHDFSELLATAIRNADNQAQLKASRARIAAAADDTSRRIERDLHDGAQQRLVSLALDVRAAKTAVPAEYDDLHAELSAIADGLVSVLDELREVSRGLHPAVLAEGGLRPALRALARRSPIEVVLNVSIEKRLPQHVEVTTYYVVAELLTNAAKHAQASTVRVSVDAADEALLVSVNDDGIGGADPGRGTGLIGLQDRVAALGGTLALHSPVRIGTRVDVRMPIGDPSGDAA
jgi:signal transduction histidine kinase